MNGQKNKTTPGAPGQAQARPRPALALARAPTKYSIFIRFYKVFCLGEPHVSNIAFETGFTRVWGENLHGFRASDREILKIRQVL